MTNEGENMSTQTEALGKEYTLGVLNNCTTMLRAVQSIGNTVYAAARNTDGDLIVIDGLELETINTAARKLIVGVDQLVRDLHLNLKENK